MARSGRLRRPGRGPKSEDQSNPKTGRGTTLVGGRFRLIVDDQGTFNPRACAPPRRTLDNVGSPSTIRLKRASTIAEIRIGHENGSRRARFRVAQCRWVSVTALAGTRMQNANLSVGVLMRRWDVCVDRILWLRGQDLNLRPLGYEPNELPDCSTSRLSSLLCHEACGQAYKPAESRVCEKRLRFW